MFRITFSESKNWLFGLNDWPGSTILTYLSKIFSFSDLLWFSNRNSIVRIFIPSIFLKEYVSPFPYSILRHVMSDFLFSRTVPCQNPVQAFPFPFPFTFYGCVWRGASNPVSPLSLSSIPFCHIWGDKR